MGRDESALIFGSCKAVPVALWELEQRLSHPEWDKKRRERSVDRTWTGARVPWGRAPGGGWGSSRRRLARHAVCVVIILGYNDDIAQVNCAALSAPRRVCFLWQQFRSAPLAFSCLRLPQSIGAAKCLTALTPKLMCENLQTLFFQQIIT